MSETETTIEDDVVLELEDSREIIGELKPVVVDQFGRILDGRHRTAAHWGSKIVVQVKDDVDFAVKRYHYKIQGKASWNDHAVMIRAICEALEKKGVAIDKIAPEVVKLTGKRRKNYTYTCIPAEYKRSGGYEPEDELPDRELTALSSPQLEKIPRSGWREYDERSGFVGREQTCPNCQARLVQQPDGVLILA